MPWCHRELHGSAGKKLRPPSLAEEAALLKYYQGKARDMCRAFGFPNKVQAAAVLFLKRFYLARSPLRHDPRHIILAAIYLAGKVCGPSWLPCPSGFGAHTWGPG